ncbi:hypothetical protein VaNZ11_005965 [Volvox africanus]|uniref:RAP domain-containing protein n=1 Tax=Volvox africanus TaxID=51714 RepID=A0ABQ5RZK5_9CHLO|nr:hypothetical protein VaNZ11_005965 [Volvox africanus]
MERRCAILRTGCLTRVSLCHAIAGLGTRRGCLKLWNPEVAAQRFLVCRSDKNYGSYDTSLTRSQAGRRQKHARHRAFVESPRWSPIEPATSRSEWLQGAKDQGTEVLLSSLLAPESVPLPRLPVLLTLVESRSDLEECLLAAGLSTVAAAVLSSDMLQRLLPGGVLLDLLLGLVEQHAETLTTKELLLLARMIAAWRPPESCEALVPAAVAVATELVKHSLELTASPGLGAAAISGSSSSGGGSSADVNASAAAPIELDAAILADAFIVLRPWLEWRSSMMAAGSGVAGISSGKRGPGRGTLVGETEGEAGEGVAAGEVMEGVRTGVMALLRSVRGRGSAEPPVLFGVLEAAVQYGVDVPSDFAKDAVRTATAAAADISSSAQPSNEAVLLAAQLAAYACCCSSSATTAGRDSGGGGLLTAAELRDLLKQHLAPQLGDTHHRGFLYALISAMHTRASQAKYLSKTQRRGVGTSMGAEKPPGGWSAREPLEGVLEALASVVGQLGPKALVLAMEYAAAVIAVAKAMEEAEAEGPRAAGAHGTGEVVDVAVRRLLAEAAAEAAGRRRPAPGADICTVDELCRLAAAAARLHRSGVVGSAARDGTTAAAAMKDAAAHALELLAVVQGLPLTEVSVEAAAALVAAAWKATPVRVSSGQVGASEAAVGNADGQAGGPPELPKRVLVALLERLAAATADSARSRRRADDTQNGTNAEMASGTPPQSLPYDHALEVLTAVTAVAELMAETAPSTSASATAPTIPLERGEMLRAAGLVACRSLTSRVRELDAPDAVGLLMLIARAQRASVRPDFPQLLWALHERLRALAASGLLAPTDILDVLSGCVSLHWRPAVLLRELLLPLLQWLQAVADGTASADFTASGSANGGVGGDRTAEGTGGGGMQSWSPRELKVALALLAKLRFSGPLATAAVKLGVGHLLRASEAEAGAATSCSSSNEWGSARLSASDLAMLLWVCVAMRYRGATVLRPLLQQLLQVPPLHVSVRAAAQAVWAAVRLGVVGERLVRWALASCQGGDKLAEAAPQNLALLCWGLAKLGVQPPRAFVTAAVAASRSQLRKFKAKELATVLFVLATWGGKLRDATDAASVVRHVIETRVQYDGPGLCTAVWALNQMSAVAAADIRRASEASAAKPAATSGVIDAVALRTIETHLLAINFSENSRIGFPDHHLLRFFSTCAAIGYRPERLLSRYATRLHLRLRTMRGVSPVDVPVEAERRARMLWSSARIMAVFNVRDPELLCALELCVERCQSQLRPGHLAGVLNAMAGLGHYPAHFARNGLLRRVGLALRRATLTEAGLIMEALAVWKPYLTAPGAGEEKGSRDVGTEDGPAAAVGNGLPAAAAAVVVEARGPGGRQHRGPTPQRLDLLRRVALARLTQLCASPPPLPTTLLQSMQQPAIAAAPTSTSGGNSGAARQSGTLPTAAPQTNTHTGTGNGSAAPAAAVAISISLDDAMRLLTALARLRWQCAPVEAALVQVLKRVPLERRRVPQLSTLMWALASLRQDTPELLEGLQAALLGLPPQPSLASDMSLMESGRVDLVHVADSSPSSVVAVAVAAATAGLAAAAAGGTAPTETTSPAKPPNFVELTPTLTLLAEAAGLDRKLSAVGSVAGASAAANAAAANVANAANAADQSATSSEGPIDGGGISTRQSTRVDVNAEGTGAADNTASSTGSAGPDVAASTIPRSDVQLLSRPAKPATSTAGGDSDEVAFDPAAATAAAAAEANQRLEKHLDGPMGRSQIPSEPWAPADIFKTLWSCAKMNRHPGPLILAVAERSWLQYTANDTATAMPLHTVTGLLWSLSVFRHHNGSFAQRLSQQLGSWLKGEGTLLGPTSTAPPATPTAGKAVGDATGAGEAGNGALSAEREVGPAEAKRLQDLQQLRAHEFLRQAVQVAACLLAAQADRAESPLNTTLSPEVRARLVAAWRSRLAQRLAKPYNRYQADLVSVLRKMGLTAAANVATPDGCALVDVAVAIRPPSPPPVAPGAPSPPPPPPRLLALELVGRHNTATNSPRILGEAVVKYRLLQARGYLVVPIPCYEWDRIDHKDIWTKMVYLQAKIERRTGSLTSSGTTVRTASTIAVPAAANLSSSDNEGNNKNNKISSNNNSGLGDGDGSGVGMRTASQVVNALSASSSERRRNVTGSE